MGDNTPDRSTKPTPNTILLIVDIIFRVVLVAVELWRKLSC